MDKFKHRWLVLVIFAALLALTIVVMSTRAEAAGEPCVPKDAWTETVEHPEVSHVETVVVVDREAYDEEVFDHWQRYSWNGPWESNTEAPPFPDDRWQPNVQGDPHGVGVEGAYFRSHGNSGKGDWFYLEAVEVTVHHEAVTHEEQVKVIDEEAWTEVIEHPAVVCPTETPTVPMETGTPTVPTETPVVTETLVVVPEEDTETPAPEDEPATTKMVRCVGNALVTVVDGPDGKSTSTVNGHPRCEVSAETTTLGQPTEVVEEEGL